MLVVLGPFGPGLASLWGFGDAERSVQVGRWLYCVRQITHCSALLVFEERTQCCCAPPWLLLGLVQVAKGT